MATDKKPNLQKLLAEGWKDTGAIHGRDIILMKEDKRRLYNPETDVSDFEYDFKLRDR